jgi:CP family cyanate transporter-like MFS transporter
MADIRTNNQVILWSIFAVALILRAPITGISPLIAPLTQSLHLSAYELSIMTALPLVCLAVFAPLAAWFASKRGIVQTLFLGIVLIALGIVLKLFGSVSWLLLGTLAVGAGVATANVMLPSIVKQFFPQQTAKVTSLYILFFGIGGAFCSAVALPIMYRFDALGYIGWKYAVGSTLLLVALPLGMWWPRLTKDTATSASSSSPRLQAASVLKSRVAWHLTLFFGLTAWMNYAWMTWLPKLLVSSGIAATVAGFQQGWLQIAGALPGLLLVPILAKNQGLRQLCTLAIGAVGLSILGLLYQPSFYMLWVTLAGIGTSSVFILAITLLTQKASTVAEVYTLSSMVQGLGYSTAALGLGGLSLLINQPDGEPFSLYAMLGMCPIWFWLSRRVTQADKVAFQYQPTSPKVSMLN